MGVSRSGGRSISQNFEVNFLRKLLIGETERGIGSGRGGLISTADKLRLFLWKGST